ncbi:MAG TPA: hypothetical protein GXZ90_06865, partial [Clostridiales bacterium]|nr:hypothetical protein [Clostridiales bacterium]
MKIMKKHITKHITSVIIMLCMMLTMLLPHLQVNAAVSNDKLSKKYLNSSLKYLHVEGKGAKTYNFNINKKAQEKGSKYTWYVKEDKGNSKSVTINKKSGLVSAKQAGT